VRGATDKAIYSARPDGYAMGESAGQEGRMIRGWVKRLLDRLGAPELDWVQVEITTRCNARCSYCPRTALWPCWPNRDMPLEDFRNLLRCLGQTRQAHLQGWGEPLLHPQFFEMVRLCKGKGLAVSTTTNGVKLDDACLRRLMESGLDVLGVSLAGVRPEANDALRAGTSMAHLADSLASLAELKARLGRNSPEVHLAYLNVSDGPDDLALLPELACGMGIAKIMISEPSPSATPVLPGLTLDRERRGLPDRELAYERLARLGATLGLEVFWASQLRRAAGLVCTENPSAACVVGVGGQVSPCVFCAPTLTGGGTRGPAPLVFGELGRDSLTDIWHSGPYSRFRAMFDSGEQEHRWPEQCMACPQRGRPNADGTAIPFSCDTTTT